MAIRISATTPEDEKLLSELNLLRYRRREGKSETIRWAIALALAAEERQQRRRAR